MPMGLCKLCLIIQRVLYTSFSIQDSWLMVRIPDNVSFEEAALCEPLSVALQACQRTDLKPSDAQVVIFGAGAIGLLVGAVSKAQGLHVTILGIVPFVVDLFKISTDHDFNLQVRFVRM
jgi:threonine dehydrogenase-like Zn-dependent dehydrogenase